MIVQEADVSIETDKKSIIKVERADYSKGSKSIDSKVAKYQGRNCYIPGEGVKCCLVVSCIFAGELESNMIKHHLKKFLFIFPCKELHRKKRWL